MKTKINWIIGLVIVLLLLALNTPCNGQSTVVMHKPDSGALVFINYCVSSYGWEVTETLVYPETGIRKKFNWYYSVSKYTAISNYLNPVDTTKNNWYLNFPMGQWYIRKNNNINFTFIN